MGIIKNLLISAVLILLIFSGLYIHSLSQVEVSGVTIDELQDISLSGFRLGGNVQLHNKGLIPVSIDRIEYRIILEESGNELASGYIEGGLIPLKQITNFPFSKKVNWVPTSEIAWGLITPGETYAKVEGIVYVADLKFIEFKIPFEMRIDLEQYIQQFAQEKIEEVLGKVTDIVASVIDKVVEGIGNILS